MQSYLILVTVGPVQEFIAAARRTRDLWFGSWLLSELSRAAALKIAGLRGMLIFPHPQVLETSSQADSALRNQQPAKVANKIVASITTNDIRNAGKEIQDAVQARLTELRNDAFDTIKDWAQEDKELAERQVNSLIECYWAAVPFAEGDDYKNQRSLLEEIMAARKSTRHFTQIDLNEQQQRYPKSSLDGQRESVIHESNYPNRDDSLAERRAKLLKLFQTFGAKQAERLSGVDLLKRRGNHKADEADFPSTSHFAALPFLWKIAQRHGAEQVRASFAYYRQGLEALVATEKMVRLEILEQRFRAPFNIIDNYDASILYMSRLAEEIETKDQATLKAAERALYQFLSVVANGQEPKAYYAILQADGDSMGKVIDNQLTVASHQSLSQQLAVFATAAEEIVQTNRGALIYAGGDDVLALLPVDTLLKCAKELHDRFDDIVGKNFKSAEGNIRFLSEEKLPATLSVGIAICHHLEPFNDGLALVRSAEKAAKQVDGKNALAIAIAKRSGEPQRIQGSWSEENGFFSRLQTWLRLMEDTELSAGAPYELRDLTERLGEPQELKPEHQTRHRAIAEEAGRIIERKQGQRGSQKLDPNDITALRKFLGLSEKTNIDGKTQLILTEKGERYGKQKLTVRKLAEELIVARELVRLGAGQLQEGKE